MSRTVSCSFLYARVQSGVRLSTWIPRQCVGEFIPMDLIPDSSYGRIYTIQDPMVIFAHHIRTPNGVHCVVLIHPVWPFIAPCMAHEWPPHPSSHRTPCTSHAQHHAGHPASHAHIKFSPIISFHASIYTIWNWISWNLPRVSSIYPLDLMYYNTRYMCTGNAGH